MNIYIEVKVRMNMRDWDAFQELISDQIKDPEVLDIQIDKTNMATKITPAKSEPKTKTKRTRKTPTRVNKETVEWIKSLPATLTNVGISKSMSKDSSLADSTISSIRRGKYDHLLRGK